jgi:nitrate reductase gamma subunit
MEFFAFLIGKVMPFITLAVFMVGLVFRLSRWQKAAVGNIALFPSASSRGELVKKVAGEVMMFSSFRKESKVLWWQTWVFHFTLVLILLGHTRLITDWPLRVLLGLSAETVHAISAWGGGICGVIAMIACILLMSRRVSLSRVREISNGEDYFVLVLLLLILVTGNAMRFLTHFDITGVQAYFASLFSGGEILVLHDPMFLLHFSLVQLLIIYMPFGKFLHIPGIFYSRTLLAKDY